MFLQIADPIIVKIGRRPGQDDDIDITAFPIGVVRIGTIEDKLERSNSPSLDFLIKLVADDERWCSLAFSGFWIVSFFSLFSILLIFCSIMRELI